MKNKAFSISEAVNKAWELTKANLGFLAGVTLLVWIIPTLIQKLLGEGALVTLVSSAVSMILSLGLITIALKVIDGKKPELEDLYKSYPLLVNYFLASVLLGIAIVLGLIFFIVPGIYLALKYQFTPYLIVDKKMGVMDAIKKSGEMTSGKLMDLFALALVNIGITILGALAFGIGLLVSAPVSMLIVAHVYRKLSK